MSQCHNQTTQSSEWRYILYNAKMTDHHLEHQIPFDGSYKL